MKEAHEAIQRHLRAVGEWQAARDALDWEENSRWVRDQDQRERELGRSKDEAATEVLESLASLVALARGEELPSPGETLP